jgi:phosphohistidine phosphatase
MRRLFLVRHAKAEGHNRTSDIERQLVERGHIESACLGAWLRENNLIPKAALVSPSQRTCETFTSLIQTLGQTPQLIRAPRLYNADVATIMDEIHSAPDEFEDLMLIGHNPAISDIADLLVGHGALELRTMIALGFPTAGIAIITFADEHWHDVKTKSGTITHVTSGGRLREHAHNL